MNLDVGQIVDGRVEIDPTTGSVVLVDDDGSRFDPIEALSSLLGKKVRLTMVSFEAIEAMEKVLASRGLTSP